MLFKRQREGSVICSSCGVLVGVNDDRCYNCGRWNPGMWGFGPALRQLGNDMGFVSLVMGGTITMYALSLLLSRSGLETGLAPSNDILLALGASGAYPIFVLGRWWTVLTAGWLHGSILHIFFNVLWIRQLGPEIANLYGAGRMVIIYTFAGIFGFALTSVMAIYASWMPIFNGAGVTVGASASVFGLLGALVHHGRRTGSSHIAQAGLQWAFLLTVMGLLFGGVDHSAHLGGFVGGFIASMVLDPLKRERIDHLAMGLVCLVVTLVALIASFVTALPELMR